MNAEDKLLKIINHYGTRHQLRKLNEETFELIEAVMNFESGNKLGYTQEEITEYRKAIVEEIADVTVLLEQIRLYYLIPEKEVIKIKWEKVERQLERIENENKSAKEMFEELGYEFKQDKHNPEITYKIKHFISDITIIYFDLQDKTFSKFTNSDSPFESSKVDDITLEEYKAIQKQIKELGWIDE